MKKRMAFGVACVLSVAISSAFTITPNPIVSSGALAYANGSSSTYLTDGNLLNWKSVNAKDIAIQVTAGPSKLFIHWESFGDCAWATDFTTGCGHSGTAFKNFKIMTSANSTNGQDGHWNLETFRKNMQTIIDSAKAHNIVPILARIIATDSAKAQWQINPKFLEAIDSLTVQNKLPKGPDLYTYFREHPELLASDGVHPNGETGGGHMIHQLWAEALYPLYENESGSGEVKIITQNTTHLKEQQVRVQGRTIRIIGALEPEFKVMLLNPIGQVLETHKIKSTDNVEFKTNAPIGNYILVIQGQSNAITTQVTIK